MSCEQIGRSGLLLTVYIEMLNHFELLLSQIIINCLCFNEVLCIYDLTCIFNHKMHLWNFAQFALCCVNAKISNLKQYRNMEHVYTCDGYLILSLIILHDLHL